MSVAVIDPSATETIMRTTAAKSTTEDVIEGISATDTTTKTNASANANNNSSKAPPPPPTAAATVNSTTLNTSSSSVNSTTAAVKQSIEEQLAEAAAAKERRRLEMSTGSLNGNNSTLNKVVNSIKSADHETIRISLVTLALVSSTFGALVLVMAGADPPTASSGSLYTYADLMRLMTAVHERSVEIVPNSLSRREWIEALRNGTLMETTTERWRELLGEWFPIRRVDFQTTDAILRDGNFYAEHYRTFQGNFIFFACLGQAVLLLSWAYFLVAKELRASRRHREELRFRVNGHGNGNGVKSRVKSPKLLSERVGEAWAKTRRVFGGGGDQNSSLKRLKRSWFDDCSERKLWKRPVVLVVGGILITDLFIFTVLMVRPNSFTLVLHQVVFVLLAVVCLASTQAKAEEKLHFQNKRFNGRSSSLLSREAPRSLRATNGANSYPSQQRNGRNKVHQSPAELIPAEPLIIEEPVSGRATPIFVTEQSALNVHKSSNFQPPPSPQPSLNPFGSFDEEEEEEGKKTSPTKKKKEKRQSIDEEAEKEVEQV